MAIDNVKNKTLSGLLYRFGERISAQLVSTLVSIVLARILLPADYGVVALVTIIITICNTFVTDGFGSALIQNKNSDQLDFSTIFWTSIGLSGVLYLILYLLAPCFALWYENAELISIIRVMSVRIPIAAINSVQQAYVAKKFLFKKFFWATFLGTVVSGIIGIIMAYMGYGVWALVAQYIINVFVGTIMLFIVVKWIPSFQFSIKRLKVLLSFGWKILVSGLLTNVYDELRSFVIAGKYSTEELSYYTKGTQFPQLISNNVSATITSVMFPVFSEYQDDKEKLKNMVRRSIRINTYVMCPLLLGLAAIANDFVLVVYTAKWLPAIPFIQIYCVLYLFKPLKNINKSCLKALGHSGVDLTLNFVEKAIGIGLIFISMNMGPTYLALSALVTYFIASMIDAFVNGKYLGYNIREQFVDIFPSLAISVISSGTAYVIGLMSINIYIQLILQILAAIIVYIALSMFFRIEPFRYLFNTVKKLLKQRNDKNESTNS